MRRPPRGSEAWIPNGTKSTSSSEEVDIRPIDEIEGEADGVLKKVPEWIWDGEALPVPIEEIADSCFGLLVRDVPDLTAAPGAPALSGGQSLSGLLLPNLGEIWVNEWEGQQWPGRRRFTIGHEIGHWVMHAPAGQGMFCRSQTVQPEDDVPIVPPIEEEAQIFSAALLMPTHLIDVLYGERPDVDGLCSQFGVTKKAMTRRLADLDVL
jgi:hypothetical protein